MKLAEAYQIQAFKNPRVAAAVLALIELEDAFEKKGQGNVLAGHLYGLATTFRDEEVAIIGIFERLQKSVPHLSPNIQTAPKQKVVLKPSNKVTKPFVDFDDCPTCDKAEDEFIPEVTKNTLEARKDPRKSSFAPPEDIVTEGLINSDDLLNAKSWRDIHNGFVGDADLMIEFCKLQGISRKNGDKPVDLAKAIFVYFEKESVA